MRTSDLIDVGATLPDRSTGEESGGRGMRWPLPGFAISHHLQKFLDQELGLFV